MSEAASHVEFLPQYAAHAVAELQQQARVARSRSHSAPFALLCERVSALIREAVHVVLPVNGEVYRDNGPEAPGPSAEECESLLGLPAPVTCFEYPWTHEKGSYPVQAPKRITLVVDGKQFEQPEEKAAARVAFFSLFYDESFKQWTVADHVFSVPAHPQILRGPTSQSWGVKNAQIVNLIDGEAVLPDEAGLTEVAGQYFPDILAVMQCCHALRAGARFEERSEQSGSRRKKFRKKGVDGFVYHVLKLPAGVRSSGPPAGGSHASPRFHLRRAHIRKLSSGSLTFVRHCFVGQQERGKVEKSYSVPPRAIDPVSLACGKR